MNLDTQSRNDELLLMHGGIKVAKLSFDNTGQISSVIQIVEADHTPPWNLTIHGSHAGLVQKMVVKKILSCFKR